MATDLLEVRTPEGVVFRYELAGVPTRALAWAVDLALIGFALVLLSWLGGLLGLLWADLGLAVQLAAAGVALWAWPTFFEGRWGRTPGKRLLGLRVIRLDGTPLDPAGALLRNVARFVDMLPLGSSLGVLSATVDPHLRRLGDRLAGSAVVRVPPRRHLPELVRSVGIDPARVERLPGLSLAVARLGAAERDLGETLLRRREALPVEVRRELFVGLARHLEARLRVPRPPHLSPEGYVEAVLFEALRRAERLRREGFA